MISDERLGELEQEAGYRQDKLSPHVLVHWEELLALIVQARRAGRLEAALQRICSDPLLVDDNVGSYACDAIELAMLD